jgi:uncharacterized protein
MISRFIAYFLLLFAFAGPVQAKAPETVTATPALWEVRAPTGDAKLYLFGTFHLLPKSLTWQTRAFGKTFKSAKSVVFELDQAEMLNPANQQLLLRRGMLLEGETLAQIVGPELYAKVAAAGQKIGVPALALQRMRPWMASVLLAVQSAKAAGFEPGAGVETVLQSMAATAKMPSSGLETMVEQIDALAALDADGAKQMLEETASELVNADKVFKEMLDAWVSGDSTKLEVAFLNDMQAFPKAYDALLKQRNLRWLPKLEALLANRKPVFVAVGAGHLIGPDGVVALLRAKGYRIHQVQPQFSN